MADRVKVIKALEICVNRVPGKYVCNKCPYEIDGNDCEINLTNDAINLLKEQEAKAKWIYCEDEYGQDGYKCSECGFFVPWFYDFETINFINDYKLCPSCRKTMESSAGGEADEH